MPLSSCWPTACSPAAKYRDCYHAYERDICAYVSIPYLRLAVNHFLYCLLLSISSFCSVYEKGRGRQEGIANESKSIFIVLNASSCTKLFV